MRGRLQQILRRTKRNLAEFKELGGYSEIYKYSIEKNDDFWEKLARSRLVWEKDFTEVSDSSFKDGEFYNLYVTLWLGKGWKHFASSLFYHVFKIGNAHQRNSICIIYENISLN